MFERVLKLRGIKILQNSVYSNKHKILKNGFKELLMFKSMQKLRGTKFISNSIDSNRLKVYF